MRTWTLLAGIIPMLVCLCGGTAGAFEIQYPGEDGFFIGKPMAYVITVDPNNEENIGQEGIFTFGQDLITIDGENYYNCTFESPSGVSHFYLGIDTAGSNLIQKGFKIGMTELIVNPAVVAVDYPLSPGDSWSEKVDMTAENLEIPGLGVFPIPISIKGVKVETEVYLRTISVPAGTFETLLVESTFSGSLLGIPITLIQRTWLSKDNVAVKRNFEFLEPTPLSLYEIELSKLTLTPWDVNWDGSVDVVDVVLVARRLNERITEPGIRNPDVNGDGIVDILDLAKVGAYLGKDSAPSAPARCIRADGDPTYLKLIDDIRRTVRRQSHRLSGDDLDGISRLLDALNQLSAGHPPTLENALLQSFPNPCNPEVWMPYTLAADSTVTIRIYNLSGRLVRELMLGYKPAGVYTSRDKAAYWDGLSDDGERVASGIYFYTIRAGRFTATRRMTVLK